MPCQILVSNQSNLPRSEIVAVTGGDHQWTPNECMQAFLSNGGVFEDWSRVFSLVIVTDKNKEDLESLDLEDDYGVRAHYFTEPDMESSEWNDLYLTGQVEREWSVISTFIEVR